MKVSIDVGFGYTKARGNGTTVVFPSVVGVLKDTDLNFLNEEFGKSEDYTVKLKENTEEKSFYVGKLALFNNFTRSWNVDKSIDDKILKVLIFTASALVSDEEEIELTVGLPLSIFQEQKERVKELLSNIEAIVSINSQKSKLIKVTKVNVLAQAVGSLMAMAVEKSKNLPSSFGVIDVGFRTIDYLVCKNTDQGIMFKGKFSGTLNEDGMNNVFKGMADRLRTQGNFISAEDLEESVIKGKFKIQTPKEQVNITDMLSEECDALASRIKDKINIHWKDIAQEVHKIYLTGGGSNQLFEYLKKSYSNLEIQEDPQFANVNGYQIMTDIHK